MVTKKRSSRKAAPRRHAARKAAPRRRGKSGITYIPSAMATVALVATQADNLKNLYNAVTRNGNANLSEIPKQIMSANTQRAAKKFVTVQNITTAGLALAGGYVAGEVVKTYAPGVIKRPLGKIAKKIPKVI